MSFPVSNFYENSVLPDVVKLLSCQVVTFIFHGSIRAKKNDFLWFSLELVRLILNFIPKIQNF